MIRQSGFSMLEVLISIVVLAFGMLGLGSLQMRLQTTYVDAQQRAQAVQIMRDIGERMNANAGQATQYVTGLANPAGVNDGRNGDCGNAALTVAERDLCQWSQRLKGVSVMQDDQALGSMIGARGCIEELRPQNPTPGVCTSGIYRVSIAWQGLQESAAPEAGLACGKGLFGEESYRRIFSSTLIVGTLECAL